MAYLPFWQPPTAAEQARYDGADRLAIDPPAAALRATPTLDRPSARITTEPFG